MADASSYGAGAVDDDNMGFATPVPVPDNGEHVQDYPGTFYVPPVRQKAGASIPRGNNPPTRFVRKPIEGRGFYPGLDGASSAGSSIPGRRRRGRY